MGREGARPNCGLYPAERCALFIKGTKITSNWKERFTRKLLDRDLREYLMAKEQWNEGTFYNICWKLQEVALKRVSKARHMAIAKLVHNLAFTGARHTQWYGGTKECCLCNIQYDDWRHVISCQSIDAELLWADSWNKLKKAMEKWKIPNAALHATPSKTRP
jgi:hypothetical protein